MPRVGPFEPQNGKESDHYHFTQIVVDNRGVPTPSTSELRKAVPVYMKTAERIKVDN